MKYIVVLVMVVLTAILGYQGYWLLDLYHSMEARARSDAREAVRVADYDEMIHRIQVLRQRKDAEHERTDVSIHVDSHSGRSTVSSDVKTIQMGGAGVMAVLPYLKFSTMLRDAHNMMQFGLYMQQGIHSGLDPMQPNDAAYFDSLLTRRLDSLGIASSHRLLHLHHYTVYHSKPRVITDTLAVFGPANETWADTIRFEMDATKSQSYVVFLPPYRPRVLRQMAGILATSGVILLVLALVFWYLVRTLMQLRTLDEMKTDFTNNMTHELKTPIAVAYAANDALLNFDAASDPARMRRYLAISQQQLQRLGGLVEQILSMSMERRKTMQLTMEPVDIGALLPPLVREQKLKAGKPVDIETHATPGVTVRADRAHLANVIGNLLDNAVKYSEGRARIVVTARLGNGGGATITVHDQGIGIDAGHLPYVFDKFYRVPQGNRHNVKGYGLGLYYVRSMMEKFGGEVSVESAPGRGTTFKLTFYE